MWDKLCHFQPWLFHSQKILRLLGIQETEAFSYWSEQCDMKLLLPAQTLCGQHVVSSLLARSEMLSQCQANTATHTWKPINKWNRKQKMKGKPHDTQILKYPSVPRPRPSSSLTESWLDCPWFFFSLQHVRSVFLGQDQEELGLKRTPSIVKNSFHHQFQHLELHSLQPETEGYRSCGRWSLLTVYLTSRSIYSEDQLSLPSLSRRFKWARRPGRRFGDGLNSIF